MLSFQLKNIKAFKDTGRVELAPITIIVGRNSCGKSSLLRFLPVLAQSVNNYPDLSLNFIGPYVDYGDYDTVVHDHLSTKKMSFSLSYAMDLRRPEQFERRPANYKPVLREVTTEVILHKPQKIVEVYGINLYCDNQLVYSIKKTKKKGEYRANLYKLIEENGDLTDTEKCEVLLNIPEYLSFDLFLSRVRLTYKNGFSKLLSDYNAVIDDKLDTALLYSEIVNKSNGWYEAHATNMFLRHVENTVIYKICYSCERYQNILNNISSSVRRDMNRLSYIGPFRSEPERVYRDFEKMETSVGVKGESTGALLINDYHNDKQVLLEGVSDWLKETMGYSLSIKYMDGNFYQIMLEDENGKMSNLMDVGYGVSQILPIVTEINKSLAAINKRIVPSNERMLVIEQPEIHLHPAMQAELADLFVDYVTRNKHKLVIETHSEHLIRKLQVLVADKNEQITNDMVRIYYVDRNDKKTAIVREMKLGENGKFLEKWPSGFFDKSYNLTMELIRRTSKKIG